MKRLQLIASNPKRTLGVLALLLVAAAVTIGSGATFTSATANPSNTFTAGNLTHSNSKNNAAILTASNMKPGESTTGNVVITNTGNVAGTFALAKSNVTSTPGPNGGNLSTQLDLKVEDITVPASPVTVYDGKLSTMPSQALGSFAASAAKTYKFTVTFPDGGTPGSATTGDNAFKSSAASVQFDWTATS